MYILERGNHLPATLEAEDDEDDLTFHWEIRKEVDPAPYAGPGEVAEEPIFRD